MKPHMMEQDNHHTFFPGKSIVVKGPDITRALQQLTKIHSDSEALGAAHRTAKVHWPSKPGYFSHTRESGTEKAASPHPSDLQVWTYKIYNEAYCFLVWFFFKIII